MAGTTKQVFIELAMKKHDGFSEGFRMAFGRFLESFRKAFGSRSEGCKNVKSNLAIFWPPGPHIHQC